MTTIFEVLQKLQCTCVSDAFYHQTTVMMTALSAPFTVITFHSGCHLRLHHTLSTPLSPPLSLHFRTKHRFHKLLTQKLIPSDSLLRFPDNVIVFSCSPCFWSYFCLYYIISCWFCLYCLQSGACCFHSSLVLVLVMHDRQTELNASQLLHALVHVIMVHKFTIQRTHLLSSVWPLTCPSTLHVRYLVDTGTAWYSFRFRGQQQRGAHGIRCRLKTGVMTLRPMNWNITWCGELDEIGM